MRVHVGSSIGGTIGGIINPVAIPKLPFINKKITKTLTTLASTRVAHELMSQELVTQ